jgi:hypothetical protein
MELQAEISLPVRKVLTAGEWKKRQLNHKKLLKPVLDPYLEKRSRQIKNPVLDFLFEYYHFRPSHLMRWSPGIGIALEKSGDDIPEISELKILDGHIYLDPADFPDNRRSSAEWISKLLIKTDGRKPSFGCFGMHEWAMVYRSGDVRHNQLPLRMDSDQIAEFVESRPLVCTHFDAYRFFTPEAQPLNKYELTRNNFIDNEQPGCIHNNMDLYKWAFKLYPWISGDIIRNAFLLAVEARYIDMQASPYDLSAEGLMPIKIETEEGRREYIEKQTLIYEKGIPIRKKLIEQYRNLIEMITVS